MGSQLSARRQLGSVSMLSGREPARGGKVRLFQRSVLVAGWARTRRLGHRQAGVGDLTSAGGAHQEGWATEVFTKATRQPLSPAFLIKYCWLQLLFLIGSE